jgi:hypothetical protein
MEGRLPEDVPKTEQVRRLRAGLVTPHSGGVGAPLGTITSPRQELADDRGWNTPAKARPGAEGERRDGAP